MTRFLIIIVALLIALPLRAYNAGCSTASDGCRTCWKGSVSTRVCPNGDWSRRDWSSWARGRGVYAPRRPARRHPVKPRERIIRRETLRFEHVIKENR